MAEGLVFHYFKSKEGILLSILEDVAERYISGCRARAENCPTGLDAVKALIGFHFQFSADNSDALVVLYEVASAYYTTLLARHLYAVNRDAVKSAEAHLKDVRVKRDQGVASDFDVLRAQVDVSLFEAQMIQQQNRVNLSKTRLLRAMGVSQDSEVDLSDTLTYAPIKPVFDEAVRIAYHERPDIYQAELNLNLQQEALRVARSEYWPKLDASFLQEWSKPDPHSATRIHWGDAWSAGLSATLPLFDGLGREGRIRQERERLKQRQILLIDT